MATVVSLNVNKDTRIARLPIHVNLRDYWDSTNKRYKSGIVKLQITNMTWTGTEEDDERADIIIRPAVYDPGCNEQAKYTPLTSADAWGGSTFTHLTAINYGQPGPSAVLEPDGTITLAMAEFRLPHRTTSDVVVTMTYSTSFTEYSPYATLPSGDSLSAAVGVVDDKNAAWGVVSKETLSGNQAVVVQLQSLASDFAEKCPNDWIDARFQYGDFPGSHNPAQFQLNNMKRNGGDTIASLSWPVPQTVGRTRTFADAFTYVFAVNNGKVDANATPVVTPEESATVYHLCSFGLTKVAASKDITNATLSYKVFSESV